MKYFQDLHRHVLFYMYLLLLFEIAFHGIFQPADVRQIIYNTINIYYSSVFDFWLTHNQVIFLRLENRAWKMSQPTSRKM